MKTSEILDKAADQIKRVGWARDDWYYLPRFGGDDWSKCKVCAGGGINVAAGLEPDFDNHEGFADDEPPVLAFMALAQRVAPDKPITDVDEAVSAVLIWNDADGRTAEQVVAELRAAAETARGAGR